MSKAKLLGVGKPCPKCQQTMKRFGHPDDWTPRPGRNFFWYWDRCMPCRHIQHYEEARVVDSRPRKHREQHQPQSPKKHVAHIGDGVPCPFCQSQTMRFKNERGDQWDWCPTCKTNFKCEAAA